jgi:hypothetical protein
MTFVEEVASYTREEGAERSAFRKGSSISNSTSRSLCLFAMKRNNLSGALTTVARSLLLFGELLHEHSMIKKESEKDVHRCYASKGIRYVYTS